MNVRDILRWLTRRAGLILLLTIVGGIAGGIYGAVKTPQYTAKAYVVAIGSAGDPNTALNFAQAYGRVATTGPILVLAGGLLGQNRSGLDSVTASTSPDAPVIEIDATGTSAQHTTDVANAVARALASYGSDRKADTKVDLSLLAGATVPDHPTSPRPPLELLVGAAGGLLIGGLAVLAGAGRAEKRAAEPAPGPEHYSAEVPRPAFDAPTEIEGHLEIWRAQYGTKAITSYRSSAAAAAGPDVGAEPGDGSASPDEGDQAADVEEADPAADVEMAESVTPEPKRINGSAYAGPIVGRAAVAGMEDDD